MGVFILQTLCISGHTRQCFHNPGIIHRCHMGQLMVNPLFHLERIKECQYSLSVTDSEILKLIPSILSGAARYWVRPLSPNWRSTTDFFAALRLQYGFPDFQARLEEEIRSRTQGPDEPISSFLANLRLLLDKVVLHISKVISWKHSNTRGPIETCTLRFIVLYLGTSSKRSKADLGTKRGGEARERKNLS